LGDYYAAVLRPEKAVQYYSTACKLAPTYGSLFARLSVVQRRTGQKDQARAAARRAYELLPNDADAAGAYGTLLAESRNRPAALDYGRHALPGMKRDPRLYTLLGQLYLDSDRTADALQIYTAGRRMAPNAEGMLRGLADCYTRLGRMDKVATTTAELRKILAR